MPQAHEGEEFSAWGRLHKALAPFLVVLALLVLAPHEAWAQTMATLNGVVSDPSGALVSEANVTLQNTQTQAMRETQTNESGVYVFVSVVPGEYTLSVSKAGFTNAKREKLILLVNQTSTQDFTLSVGTSAQSITVAATAVTLETSGATLGTVIELKQVSDLPLNGRNFTQLLSLTPGVSPVSTAQNAAGGEASPIGAFTFPSINGQSNRSNWYMVDGIDDTDMTFSTYAVAPIIDDIQEFKVQSHNDEVHFGGVTGGIVNVVTKSGTDQYHLAAWEYMRNTILDAKNYFSGLPKLVQNQFGFNGGGPVRIPHLYDGRHKTFFFGSYEGFRKAQPAGTFYNVPTAEESGGDFSGLCQSGFTSGICNDRSASGQVIHQLYNPFTTRANASGTGFIRDPFPGNIIPANLINAGAVAYAKAVIPAPLTPINGFNGYDFSSAQTHVNQYSWRVDENFNPSNSVFFRYSRANQPDASSGGTTNFTTTTTTLGEQYVASYYHTFSPSTFFDFEFGHVELTQTPLTAFHGNATEVVQSAGFDPSFACGYASVIAGLADCQVPAVGLANYTSAGEGYSSTSVTNNYEWRGNLTKVVRNHTLTGGFSFEAAHFAVWTAAATVSFGTAQTEDPLNGGGNTGNSFASFLLGIANGGSRTTRVAPEHGQRGTGVYFMDKWRVTDRLTLNLGLRYDVQVPPIYGKLNDPASAFGEIDFNNGTYILERPVASCANTGNIAPCIPGSSLPANVVISPDNHLWRTDKTDFQPRVGLAYRLTDNTVIRAGFGITDDLWAGIAQTVIGVGGSWPSNTSPLVSTNATGEPVTVNWQNPLRGAGLTNGVAPTPFNQLAFFRDPQAKNPYSEQWNFGLERQFGGNTVVSATYVGSQDHRLDVGGLYNTALTPGPNLNPDGTLATTPDQIAAAFASRQQWPGISPTFYDRSVGSGSYNALQLSAKHEAAHGLTYILSYTWSKAIDVGSDGFFGVEGMSINDPYNLKDDRSVAGYDLPHVFSASFTAESPIGKGRRFSSNNSVVDYIVGNWQVNGIFTYTSGQPFTVSISGDTANTLGGVIPLGYTQRADLVGDPNTGSCPNGAAVHTVTCWFNTNAFAVPAPYTFGNSGRNMLRGDQFSNLDLSLFRFFPLGEKHRLEFRAEAFNLLNHVNLGLPDDSGLFNAIVGSPTYGQIFTTRGSERQLQLALKLVF